jgi:hypothetical protein
MEDVAFLCTQHMNAQQKGDEQAHCSEFLHDVFYITAQKYTICIKM